MNKEQALKKDQEIKAYMEKNKLRHLFVQLTKQLLLKRPEQPLAYLINYLEKRNRRTVVCFQGYDEEKRTRLATALSTKFNFSLINLHVLFGSEDYHFLDSHVVSKRVLQEIKKVDKIYRGIVVSGFPNNIIQADELQKSGIIPERYFMLHNDEPAVRSAYQKRHNEEQVELLLDRNSLELKELKELLKERYDQLPLTVQKAQQKVNSTIGIRLRKVAPLDSPRIVVLHPPFLVPKSLNALIERYSLYKISVEESFRKMIKKEQFKNIVETHIRQNKCLSKETQLALVETECRSGTAKAKGFVISGWPNRRQSLPFLKHDYLNPHIIFAFTSLKEKAVEEFDKLGWQDDHFCIHQKPKPEQYKNMLKQYEMVVQSLKSSANCQLLPLHESQQQVIKTFQSLIQNAKIYS